MTVNPQITDSVTQANVSVLGDAPAMAMGNIYQALAHSTSVLFENAVAAQQQMNVIAQAATTMGVSTLYSIDTSATAASVEKVLQDGETAVHAAMATIPVKAPRAGEPDDLAYCARSAADALSAAIEEVSHVQSKALLRVLQIAATSACLTAMIAQPDKASSYEEVLAAIKRIV